MPASRFKCLFPTYFVYLDAPSSLAGVRPRQPLLAKSLRSDVRARGGLGRWHPMNKAPMQNPRADGRRFAFQRN
jgi:hypothetical protein